MREVITTETDWTSNHRIIGIHSKKLNWASMSETIPMYSTTLRQKGSLSWPPHFREPCFGLPLATPLPMKQRVHRAKLLHPPSAVPCSAPRLYSGWKGESVGHSVMSNFGTTWTVACQAPLSVGFPRQEYWSGESFPSPVDIFLTKGSNPALLFCKQILYHLSTSCFGCPELNSLPIQSESASQIWAGLLPGQILHSLGLTPQVRPLHSWVCP